MFRRDYEYQLLGDVSTQRKRSRLRRNKLVLLFIALLVIMIIILYFSLVWKPKYNFPVSPSKLAKYKQAAVTTGATMCSEIGKTFLENKNASTVDAALATLICLDIGMPMSSGIGGGSFIMVYDIKTEKTTFIDARETAPHLATKNMFLNKSSTKGSLSVAVPGQVYGIWSTHKKFGKLPWKDLFTPTINLTKYGFKVPYSLAQTLKRLNTTIFKTPGLKRTYVNPVTGACYREGEILKRPLLAETLTQIANDGYLAFYNGSLSSSIIQDLKNASNDSIMSLEDLATYTAVEKEGLKVELKNGNILYAAPPPSSGTLVQFILNVLDNYDLKPNDLTDVDKLPLTIHRIVETFKFAFAERSSLGDEDFWNVTEIVTKLTSFNYAKSIKQKINDKKTYGIQYYHPHFANTEDHGTAHMNVLGPDGSAVSITSTLNHAFGSKICGSKTDICFNNEMDDFSSPRAVNYFGLPPSEANFIEPGKRPMSSMSPIIIVNQKGEVLAVLGGSGGTKITTAVAYVAVNLLWLGNNAKQGVDALRIHDQLSPPRTLIEPPFPQNVVDELKLMGHNLTEYGFRSKVHCIHRKDNFVYANVDFRRGGDPAGF